MMNLTAAADTREGVLTREIYKLVMMGFAVLFLALGFFINYLFFAFLCPILHFVHTLTGHHHSPKKGSEHQKPNDRGG